MKKTTLIKGLVFISVIFSCSRTGSLEEIYDDSLLQVKVVEMQLVSKADISETNNVGVLALNSEIDQTGYGKNGVTGIYGIEGSVVEGISLLNEKAVIYSHQPLSNSLTVDNGIPYIPISLSSIKQEYIVTPTQISPIIFFTEGDDYKYGVTYRADAAEGERFMSTQPFAISHGKEAINVGSQEVTIGLKHAFAQLKLIIKKEDGIGAESNLTAFRLKRSIPKLAQESRMNLKNGKISNVQDPIDGETAYTIGLSSYKLAMNSSMEMSLLTLPDLPRTYTIELDLDGKTILSEPIVDKGWEAGFIYTYQISIKAANLTIAPIEVEQWKTAETIEKVDVY